MRFGFLDARAGTVHSCERLFNELQATVYLVSFKKRLGYQRKRKRSNQLGAMFAQTRERLEDRRKTGFMLALEYQRAPERELRRIDPGHESIFARDFDQCLDFLVDKPIVSQKIL